MSYGNERCETCRFWECFTANDQDDSGKLAGVCLRYPPTVQILLGEQVEVWPLVTQSKWCGEWQEVEQVFVLTEKGRASLSKANPAPGSP